jgi:hypothetical protein
MVCKVLKIKDRVFEAGQKSEAMRQGSTGEESVRAAGVKG